jgi:hypothetical protein
MTKVSMVLIAALGLAGCGGDGSGGSPQVSVPNVAGVSQPAASSAITGAGLMVGAVTMQSSSTVIAGDVISENPTAGSSVARGSAVALLISSGPATVAVPNVVGNTQVAATTALTGAGLTVGSITQQSSGSVASGDIISENPAAATSVTKGSAVALVVSSGPTTYSVGGTVIGLGTNATVHILNGADSVAVSANGPFTLPTGVVSGGTYTVTAGTPSSAQTCAVQNASGTVASAKVTNVVVYCTFNVSNATLNNTYTGVAVDFNTPSNGTPLIVDEVGPTVYNGAGSVNATVTLNVGGTILTGATESGTYAVATTNAIPSLTGSSGENGGIEGVNGAAAVSVGTTSGTPSSMAIAVLANATATTDSINGNYTLVDISAQLSSGKIYGYVGTGTLANGIVSGTYTENIAGTITTGNPASAQWSVNNGLVTSVGAAQGAVSVDGNLIILADTHSGDDPFVNVAVRQGSGVTQTTFEGVYSVTQYGGFSVTSTFGKAITLFAYGDGTYSIVFTKNAQGIITTNNTDSGTYTVAADGTLTLTDSDANLYNGAISADGNALVLGSITSNESPAIFVGVRQ